MSVIDKWLLQICWAMMQSRETFYTSRLSYVRTLYNRVTTCDQQACSGMLEDPQVDGTVQIACGVVCFSQSRLDCI